MKKLWASRKVEAPAEVMWRLLTDLERWPEWGPSVRDATLDRAGFERGATGTVTTAVGIDLAFEITECVPGSIWAWKVAGVPATHHRVEQLGSDRCRVSFGVPWIAAPYLGICELALRRLEAMATDETRIAS